jgi:hypothetical protein
MEEIKNIISEYKDRPNKDLVLAMEALSSEFDKTKDAIIKLTFYLETVEKSYDKLLKEYNERNNGKL